MKKITKFIMYFAYGFLLCNCIRSSSAFYYKYIDGDDYVAEINIEKSMLPQSIFLSSITYPIGILIHGKFDIHYVLYIIWALIPSIVVSLIYTMRMCRLNHNTGDGSVC